MTKIAGKTILQGELVDVLECEKCDARWTNQQMDCYHCAASNQLNVPKQDK